MRKVKTFIPERYHMIFCPNCKGFGKFYGNGKEFQVCPICGGFGAIRKPEEKVIHSMSNKWNLALSRH